MHETVNSFFNLRQLFRMKCMEVVLSRRKAQHKVQMT